MCREGSLTPSPSPRGEGSLSLRHTTGIVYATHRGIFSTMSLTTNSEFLRFGIIKWQSVDDAFYECSTWTSYENDNEDENEARILMSTRLYSGLLKQFCALTSVGRVCSLFEFHNAVNADGFTGLSINEYIGRMHVFENVTITHKTLLEIIFVEL